MPEKRKRGRPKKVSVTENEQILSDESSSLKMSEKKMAEQGIPVSIDQTVKEKKSVTMNSVQNGLTSLYQRLAGTMTGAYEGIHKLNDNNPFLQNTRLKLINEYPTNAAPKEVAEYLNAPQFNERNIRGVGWGASSRNHLYYRILRQACDVPACYYYYTPPLLEKEEYLEPKFTQEEQFVDEWMERFDFQNLYKRIAFEVKRDGKSSYFFRQSITGEGKNKKVSYVTLQKVPTNWTKLTAIGQYGYIASFNMLIFMNPAFSPKQYPKYIQDIWEDLITGKVLHTNGIKEGKFQIDFEKLKNFTYNYEGTQIKGALEIAKDSFMYWVQIPNELCVTFSSDSSHPWVVPDTAGLFTLLQELTDYGTLAALIMSTPLTAILTGEALPAQQPEAGKDMLVLDSGTMLKFQEIFNSMVSTNTASFLAPFKDMRLQSLPSVPNSFDIMTHAIQNFVSQAGEGGLIITTDKPSIAMVKTAQKFAEAQYDFVTQQFATAINMFLRTFCDLEYEWKIYFFGGIFTSEDQKKFLKELIQMGHSHLLPKLLATERLTMRQARAVNNYITAFEMYDDFKHMNKSAKDWTVNGDESTVGRPGLDENDIENDATAQSREEGQSSDMKEDYSALDNKCIACGEDCEDGHVFCEQCEMDREYEEDENG